MAHINNPRKSFQFSVIIQGITPFLVQNIKLPDVDLDTDEHGDAGYKVKTAGMKNYGMLSVSKICEALPLIDTYVWSWINTIIRNDFTGGGSIPSLYKASILVEQYGPDGATVVQRWTFEGCWPKRINGVEFNRAQSGNTVESIDFEIDRMTVG